MPLLSKLQSALLRPLCHTRVHDSACPQQHRCAAKRFSHSAADGFPIDGTKVEVLSTPPQFLSALLDGVARAQRRLTLASLYVDVAPGPTQRLVAALAAAVTDAGRPRLRTHVLLDAMRATRPTALEAGGHTSSADLLRERLLRPRQEQAASSGGGCELYLYQTPALRGLLKQLLPARIREVLGVLHLKACVFDDDVLLTGANFGNTYFTTRQDRYVLLRDAPQLADYLQQLVEVLSAFSLRVLPEGGLAPRPEGAPHPSQAAAFLGALRPALEGLSGPEARLPHSFDWPWGPSSWDRPEALSSVRQCPPSLQPATAAAGAAAPGVSSGPAPGEDTEPATMSGAAGGRAEQAQEAAGARARSPAEGEGGPVDSAAAAVTAPCEASTSTAGPPPPGSTEGMGRTAREGAEGAEGRAAAGGAEGRGARTWVLPVLQLGLAGVRREEELTRRLLASAPPGARLVLSSAYLNLAPPYEAALAANAGVHLALLTAAPEANGFLGARDISGLIPEAYDYLARATWHRLSRAWRRQAQRAQHALGQSSHQSSSQHQGQVGRSGAERLSGEAEGEGSGPEPPQGAGVGPRRTLQAYQRPGWEFHAKGIWYTPPGAAAPTATLLGSSNLGRRSASVDLELQLLLTTREPALQQARTALAGEVAALQAHAGDVDTERPLRHFTPAALISRLVKGLL